MALRTSRLPEALPSGGRHTRSKRPASSPPPPTAAKRRAREPHVEITNVPKTSGRSRRPVRPAAPLPEPEPEETRNVSLQPPAPPAHERPSWQLFGWGANDSAQLGMGRYSEELSKPTRNQAVEDLIANGQFGEVGAGLEAIAAGGFHSLAVSEDGAVWSFGSNDDAALGRPSAEGDDLGPGRIQSLVDEGFRAVRVVAGDCFSAALSESGELRVWGLYHSTAADGMRAFSPSIAKQPTPIQIPELANERFASIAGGSDHLVLLTVAGEVYTVGCGDSGQLGYRVPATNPVLGTIPHKVLRVSRGHRALVVGAGGYTSFFVDERGVKKAQHDV
ncbi:hypothetical protein BN946_scf184996.g40 [Trametes cinnabarina]|uniref:RCC1-like domain-containing protein n=1 Tax=Pycnoporus cinnabarinus TaxID=5643 RepID=A0A060S8J5_PYCCI|nr:hypothetical protein BN946_scf184996.g40 [Trametes cinnabarina]